MAVLLGNELQEQRQGISVTPDQCWTESLPAPEMVLEEAVKQLTQRGGVHEVASLGQERGKRNGGTACWPPLGNRTVMVRYTAVELG